METVKEYQLIYGMSEHELEEQVNALIKQGWKPLGGASISVLTKPGAWNLVSAQAMVR